MIMDNTLGFSVEVVRIFGMWILLHLGMCCSGTTIMQKCMSPVKFSFMHFLDHLQKLSTKAESFIQMKSVSSSHHFRKILWPAVVDLYTNFHFNAFNAFVCNFITKKLITLGTHFWLANKMNKCTKLSFAHTYIYDRIWRNYLVWTCGKI